MPVNKCIETLESGVVICFRDAEGNITLSGHKKNADKLFDVVMDDSNAKVFYQRLREVLKVKRNSTTLSKQKPASKPTLYLPQHSTPLT